MKRIAMIIGIVLEGCNGSGDTDGSGGMGGAGGGPQCFEDTAMACGDGIADGTACQLRRDETLPWGTCQQRMCCETGATP